jgi:hypothetical protein
MPIKDHDIGLDQIGIDTHNIIGLLGWLCGALALRTHNKGQREDDRAKGRDDQARSEREGNQVHRMTSSEKLMTRRIAKDADQFRDEVARRQGTREHGYAGLSA